MSGWGLSDVTPHTRFMASSNVTLNPSPTEANVILSQGIFSLITSSAGKRYLWFELSALY